MRYNCNWVYSILPSRIEFQVTDRESGDIIVDTILGESSAYRELLESDMDSIVLQFVEQYGVKVFNWNKLISRNTSNYIGRGIYNATV